MGWGSLLVVNQLALGFPHPYFQWRCKRGIGDPRPQNKIISCPSPSPPQFPPNNLKYVDGQNLTISIKMGLLHTHFLLPLQKKFSASLFASSPPPKKKDAGVTTASFTLSLTNIGNFFWTYPRLIYLGFLLDFLDHRPGGPLECQGGIRLAQKFR